MTATIEEPTLAGAPESVPLTQWQLFRRRFVRHKVALVAVVVLVVLAIACFAADLIAPYPNSQQNLLLGAVGPRSAYWLGTDTLGRDAR